jgi:hypothetical protein
MLRLVFVTDTFVASAYGIALLVAPAFMMQLYGIEGGTFLTRVLGAFVLGQGPMQWWARDQTSSPAGLAIARGHGITDVVCTVACVAAIFSGAMNAVGWTVVVLFAAFGSVRVYCGFLQQPAPARAV